MALSHPRFTTAAYGGAFMSLGISALSTWEALFSHVSLPLTNIVLHCFRCPTVAHTVAPHLPLYPAAAPLVGSTSSH